MQRLPHGSGVSAAASVLDQRAPRAVRAGQRCGGKHRQGIPRLSQRPHRPGKHPGIIPAAQSHPASLKQGEQRGKQVSPHRRKQSGQSQKLPRPSAEEGGGQQAEQADRRRDRPAEVVGQLPFVQPGEGKGAVPQKGGVLPVSPYPAVETVQPTPHPGGTAVGHFHIRNQPRVQQTALQNIVAEHLLGRKLRFGRGGEGFHVDQPLAGEDSGGEAVHIQIPRRDVIGSDSAHPCHRAGEGGAVGAFQLGADPGSKQAVPLRYPGLSVRPGGDDRPVERVEGDPRQLGGGIQQYSGIRVQRQIMAAQRIGMYHNSKFLSKQSRRAQRQDGLKQN